MEIADILFRKTKDPRIQSVTVTDVEMTRDLRQARVFFTTLAEEEAQVLEGLSKATGFIRGELSRRLSLRYSPELIFKKDVSGERRDRILSLLDELHGTLDGEQHVNDHTKERSSGE
jgi:ribosome-binding factor A